jgi:hypothetical protein
MASASGAMSILLITSIMAMSTLPAYASECANAVDNGDEAAALLQVGSLNVDTASKSNAQSMAFKLAGATMGVDTEDKEGEEALDAEVLPDQTEALALLDTKVMTNSSMTPETLPFPDGSTSQEGYCPSRQRKTLDRQVTALECHLLSCTHVFAHFGCGPYFYTAAQVGNESSKAACKCCTRNSPTFYRSRSGNKVYRCR